MKTKYYLKQLEGLEFKIENKKRELTELKIMAEGTGGFSNEEKVQSSTKGDALENKVIRFVDLENEINDELYKLATKRHDIINMINKLDNPMHIKILYMRYIEHKNLKIIAHELSLEYGYIRKMHGYALEEFRKENKVSIEKYEKQQKRNKSEQNRNTKEQ